MTEQVAVLITDIEGSTAFGDTRGDASAMDLVRAHEAIVQRCLPVGGRQIKTMGDGAMLAFDTPDLGIACALDMQDAFAQHNDEHPGEPLRVRMGLNVGPVIEEGGDIYGTTVNAVARIAAKAQRGQLLVSEAAKNSLDSDSEWVLVDRGLYWLKGLRERWRLFEVARTSEAIRPAAIGAGRTPFVGREDERASLRLLLDAAIDGRGAFAVLSGDAGVGKTRLAEELSAEADGRGMRTFTARCFEASQAHPFAPFVEILERVERETDAPRFRALLGEAAPEISRLLPHLRRRYPDIPPPAELPPDQERRYLFASLRSVLSGLCYPTGAMIVLDDLHFADEPTLLFLEQLADELAAMPLFVVATYIDAEASASGPLRRTIDKLVRRRSIERIALGSLTEGEVASFLDAFGASAPPPEFVTFLFRETEGNAFFLEEVVRHLGAEDLLFDRNGAWRSPAGALLDVPETVRLAVSRRLDALSDDSRRVLTTVSAIGRDFGLELVDRLVDVDEDALLDALDDAERAGLLTSSDDGGGVRFKFAHQLIRQTLLAEASLTRRQLLHVRVADAMEDVYTATLPEHSAEIAYHLGEAGRRADPTRTCRFLVMAGERAIEAAAYEEGARYFDRALALLPAGEPAARAPLIEKLGLAERSSGPPGAAIATWREAIDAYDAAGDRQAIARLCLDAGVQVARWLRRRESVELAERGLAALGDEPSPVRAGLIALAGIAAGDAGRYEQADERLTEALEMARGFDDDRILGMVLYSKAANHFTFSQFAQCVEYGQESVDHLRRAGDLWNLANVQGFVGQSFGWMGRFAEAYDAAEGAKPLAERLGNWVAYVYADRARAWRYLATEPDIGRLKADGRRDLELGDTLGYDWLRSVGFARMSVAAFWQGDWEEAIDLAEEAAQSEGVGAGGGHTARLFLLKAYTRQVEEANGLLATLRRDVARSAMPLSARNSVLSAVEGLAILGRDDDAYELYPAVIDAMSDGTVFRGWDTRLIRSIAGISAGCGREWDVAEQHFEAALAQAESLPFRIEEPDTCRFFAEMLLKRGGAGDASRARELLDRAVGAYGKLGMPSHRALAERRLATLPIHKA